jgi:hypothetical protein
LAVDKIATGQRAVEEMILNNKEVVNILVDKIVVDKMVVDKMVVDKMLVHKMVVDAVVTDKWKFTKLKKM